MEAVLRTVYSCLPPPPILGSDRCGLSKLPESLKWEIVRRLDVKDAVRLSVLSRYWYHFVFPECTSSECICQQRGHRAMASEHSAAGERRTTPLEQLSVNEAIISLGGSVVDQAAVRLTEAVTRHSLHIKEASCVGRNRCQDRISSLPNVLRQNIVARLPIKDAVRTQVLSSQWRNDWSSTPLHLDDGHLPCREDQFIQLVSRVLMAHPGPFQCIRLSFTCFNHRPDALDLWISLLAKKRVQDLVLVNRPLPIDTALPGGIMKCTSLRRLHLGFFRFPSTDEHQRVIFRELREIGLHCMVIDSVDLSHLLCSAPLLERFFVVASYGFPASIRFRGHKNLHIVVIWLSVVKELSIMDSIGLKRLILWNNSHGASKVTISFGNTPSLQLLGYLEPGFHNLVINNVAIQAGRKANPHIVVPSVNTLGCKLSFRDKHQSNMLLAFLRCFPHVETLHIQSVKADKPEGKLNLNYWLNKADAIECVEKHLKKLFFHQFHGERSELAFLKFIWMKAKYLEQMVIILSTECLDREHDTRLKLVDLGSTKRASKEPRLLVIDSDIPMMFHIACNASIKDPFFCLMDHLELSTDDQEQMVKGVKPAVELVKPVVGLSRGLSTDDQEQMVKGVKPAVELVKPVVELSSGLSTDDQEQMVKGVKPAVELSSGHSSI